MDIKLESKLNALEIKKLRKITEKRKIGHNQELTYQRTTETKFQLHKENVINTGVFKNSNRSEEGGKQYGPEKGSQNSTTNY